MYNIYNIIIITIIHTVQCVVCTYLGTIKGEKLNEPESDPSPNCKKKNVPNPTRRDSACRAPLGHDGLAGL